VTSSPHALEYVTWRKSSHSAENGSCVEVGVRRKAGHSDKGGLNRVEVAAAERAIAVRDSKHPDGDKLAFSGRAWGAFAEKLKKDLSFS
jgi:hypothetical protein